MCKKQWKCVFNFVCENFSYDENSVETLKENEKNCVLVYSDWSLIGADVVMVITHD